MDDSAKCDGRRQAEPEETQDLLAGVEEIQIYAPAGSIPMSSNSV